MVYSLKTKTNSSTLHHKGESTNQTTSTSTFNLNHRMRLLALLKKILIITVKILPIYSKKVKRYDLYYKYFLYYHHFLLYCEIKVEQNDCKLVNRLFPECSALIWQRSSHNLTASSESGLNLLILSKMP